MPHSTPPPLSDDEVARRRAVLGVTLRDRRLAAGLSQEALAERAGLERKTISRTETGTHAVSIDGLIRIAAALGISEGELLATG